MRAVYKLCGVLSSTQNGNYNATSPQCPPGSDDEICKNKAHNSEGRMQNAMSCSLLTCHLTIYCRICAAATELGDRGTDGFLGRRADTTCSSGSRSSPSSSCRSSRPTCCTARCTTAAAGAACPTTCLVPLVGQTLRRAGN